MIRVNIKYTTVDFSGHKVIRDTEWVQSTQTITLEDLEFDHFMRFISDDSDDLEEQNELKYGTVKSIDTIEIQPGNFPDDLREKDALIQKRKNNEFLERRQRNE
jgi:hypothetical protein